jgi:hypothetical protein
MLEENYIRFLRQSLVLVLSLNLVSFISDWNVLFGQNKIIPNELNNIYLPKYFIGKFLYDLIKIETLLLGYIITLIFSLFYSRISLIILLLIFHNLIFKSNILINYGFDNFSNVSISFLLLFLISSKLGKDNKNILKLYLITVYFYNGLNKLHGDTWRNGEALWKAFNLNYSNIKNFNSVLFFLVESKLIHVFNWITIFIQLFYGLIIIRKFKCIILFSIILMHIVIGAVFNIPFFSAIMLILNLTAFYNFKNY